MMNSPISRIEAPSSDLNETFVLTPRGLQINGTPTFAEWAAYGQTLWDMRSAIQWAIADWIAYGEHAYGDKYTQAMEETKISYRTLANYVWVATKFPVSRRRENLSFAHHQELAAVIDPAIQDEILDRAATEKLGRDTVRELAKPFKPVRPERIQPHKPVTPLPAEQPRATQTNVPILTGHALVFNVSGEKATLRIDNTALLDALKEAQRCDYPVYVMIQRTSTRPEFAPVIDAMARFGRTSTRLPVGQEEIAS